MDATCKELEPVGRRVARTIYHYQYLPLFPLIHAVAFRSTTVFSPGSHPCFYEPISFSIVLFITTSATSWS